MAYKNAVLDDGNSRTSLKQINPAFGDFCTRVAGEAWGLPLIDQKTKALITIAVDVVNQDQSGPGNPFGAHVNMALSRGPRGRKSRNFCSSCAFMPASTRPPRASAGSTRFSRPRSRSLMTAPSWRGPAITS